MKFKVSDYVGMVSKNKFGFMTGKGWNSDLWIINIYLVMKVLRIKCYLGKVSKVKKEDCWEETQREPNIQRLQVPRTALLPFLATVGPVLLLGQEPEARHTAQWLQQGYDPAGHLPGRGAAAAAGRVWVYCGSLWCGSAAVPGLWPYDPNAGAVYLPPPLSEQRASRWAALSQHGSLFSVRPGEVCALLDRDSQLWQVHVGLGSLEGQPPLGPVLWRGRITE